MIGEGREDQKQNDLFFVCALIEYIARKTKNRRSVVVNAIGKEGLKHIYDYADVYHCENIDKLSDEFISEYHIMEDSYDNVSKALYRIPTHWEIGKVYKRLTVDVASATGSNYIDALMLVFNSWIVEGIDNYNSSMFYESPHYLFESYKAGYALT